MRIPSPDAALVALTDRVLARAQRTGAPLPLLLAFFPHALVGCAVAEGAVLAARGHAALLGFLFLPGLLAVHVAIGEARGYGRDARRWGRREAEAYGRRAARARDKGAGERACFGLAAGMALLLCALALLNGLPGAGGFVADAGLLAAGIAILAGRAYALCARPAYPRPQGAGALPRSSSSSASGSRAT